MNYFTKLVAIAVLFNFGFQKSHAQTEYSLGASYGLNGQNSFSRDSTFDLSVSVLGSIIEDETHEYGAELAYNFNSDKHSDKNFTIESSSFISKAFYRYRFLISGDEASFPIVVYLGPNLGYAATSSLASDNGASFFAGLSSGLNIFIAKDFAVDFLFLDANKIFKTNRYTLGQSIGFRFFF